MRATRESVKRDYAREHAMALDKGLALPKRFIAIFAANHGGIPLLHMGRVDSASDVVSCEQYDRYRGVFHTRTMHGEARYGKAPVVYADGRLMILDRKNGRTIASHTFDGISKARALYLESKRHGTGGSIKPPGGRKFTRRGFDAARGDGREGFAIHAGKNPGKFTDNRF